MDREIETISVYYANYFWNNIYDISKKSYNEGKLDSMSDAYTYYVNAYVDKFASNDRTSLINDLCFSCAKFLGVDSSYMEFIRYMGKCLLPGINRKMTQIDVRNAVEVILKKSIRLIGAMVVDKYMSLVCAAANRNNNAMLKQLKNDIAAVFVGEKEKFVSAYISQSEKSSADLRISADTKRRLEAMIKEYVTKIKSLEATLAVCSEQLEQSKIKEVAYVRKISELETAIKQISIEPIKVIESASKVVPVEAASKVVPVESARSAEAADDEAVDDFVGIEVE
jgi:hypothetical protein